MIKCKLHKKKASKTEKRGQHAVMKKTARQDETPTLKCSTCVALKILVAVYLRVEGRKMCGGFPSECTSKKQNMMTRRSAKKLEWM